VRFRASFPVDAASAEQAHALAVDAMRPRAAPTRDGKPPVIRIVAEPELQHDPRVMRWSWTGADVTIAYEQTETAGQQRCRGVVAIYREHREPQIEALYLPPAKMAELVRAIGLFPVDLMDDMAMQDMKRRQGVREIAADAFGELPTLGGGGDK
jgi:hypothetical protein